MTFPILGGNGAVATYSIDNSLRFNDDDSPDLSFAQSTPTDGTRWTWSGWVKRGNLFDGSNAETFASSYNGTNTDRIQFFGVGDNQLHVEFKDGASTVLELHTSQLFRDVSAWYHIIVAFDSNLTQADRVKIYVNGTRVTSFSTETQLSTSGYTTKGFNANSKNFVLGAYESASKVNHYDGYMAEVYFIDGQALSPTDFGEFDEDSGIWKPIRYSGSYGNNGFKLDFSDSGSLGADQSGNGNNFTPTNLASTDQTTDTPTNNFATLNPLANGGSALQEGSLECITSTGGFWGSGATQGITSGKWYMEFRDESGAGFFGITDDVSESIRLDNGSNDFLGAGAYEYAFAPVLGRLYNDYRTNTSFTSFTTTGFGAGDVIGVAFDMDNKKIYYSVDGTFQNSQDPVNGTNPAQTVSSTPDTYFFAGSDGSGAASRTFQANFGQDSSFAGNLTRQNNSDGNGYGDFYYSPPSGYLALCTQNLATELSPTIDDGSQYFNTTLVTSTGSDITINTGFKPDFLWTKSRSYDARHELHNTTSGDNKRLVSNLTSAEETFSNYMTFLSDGATFKTNVPHALAGGGAGRTGVAWSWRANAGSTSSNTDGDITTTVQANTTSGFSILTWTGNGTASQSLGHGLGVTPKIMIQKNRDQVEGWQIFGSTLFDRLQFDTGAEDANLPCTFSSTTITLPNLSNNNAFNSSGDNFVSYVFAEIEGYSKFGSYTGNGSTDGTFVYTGFRPAFVMIKRTDASGHNWILLDNKRDSSNVADTVLIPNSNNVEFTETAWDFVSNGFKLRQSATSYNASGGTFIYMAFAENPFVSSTGIPVTAR